MPELSCCKKPVVTGARTKSAESSNTPHHDNCRSSYKSNLWACSIDIYTLDQASHTHYGENLKAPLQHSNYPAKNTSFSSNGENTLLDVSNQPNSSEHVVAADNQMQEAQLFQQLQQLSVMTVVDEKRAQP
jgi:hypothetical protein